MDAIRKVLPTLKQVSPEISLNSYVIQGGKRETAKMLGVSNEYFNIYNLPLEYGSFFNDYQEENGIPVCVIGANIRKKFFSNTDPIGKYIKFGQV